MLDSYRVYMDLVGEIEVLEIQVESALQERENWHFMNPNRLGRTLPLDEAAKRMDKLSEQIEWLSERLEVKRALRIRIEKKLNEFEGLEFKVAYLRVVENKKLEDIAEELELSIDYIKKMSAKVSLHFKYTDTVAKLRYANNVDN